uniref:Uncharacterized protein n=1 Tax=Physcomitrium patens TaxID=3218 RepID=A0A2K1IYN1_PHYPA|nr:hypothetical protein PHYPA_024207 [Physcomitrium patens]
MAHGFNLYLDYNQKIGHVVCIQSIRLTFTLVL